MKALAYALLALVVTYIMLALCAAPVEGQANFTVWAEQSPAGENAFHCVFRAESTWPMSSMDARCSPPGYTARRCSAIPPRSQRQAFELQCSTTGWYCPEGEENVSVNYEVQATGGGSEWGTIYVDCAGQRSHR